MASPQTQPGSRTIDIPILLIETTLTVNACRQPLQSRLKPPSLLLSLAYSAFKVSHNGWSGPSSVQNHSTDVLSALYGKPGRKANPTQWRDQVFAKTGQNSQAILDQAKSTRLTACLSPLTTISIPHWLSGHNQEYKQLAYY